MLHQNLKQYTSKIYVCNVTMGVLILMELNIDK
jgi:hypothetical protein